MNKFTVLFLAVSISTLSLAGTVTWKGDTWVEYIDGIAAVDGSDSLVVTTTAMPGLTRLLYDTDFFEVTVDLDQGPESTIMVADYSPNLGAQIAVNMSSGPISS